MVDATLFKYMCEAMLSCCKLNVNRRANRVCVCVCV